MIIVFGLHSFLLLQLGKHIQLWCCFFPTPIMCVFGLRLGRNIYQVNTMVNLKINDFF